MRLALALALLLIPAGVAQVGTVTPEQVETKLYLHPLNLQGMAINTQMPQEGQWTGGPGYGITGTTATCIQKAGGDPAPTQGVTGQEWHRYYGYSSPSFVEYDFTSNGHPRVWPERGLGFDVPLDSDAVLFWTMHAVNGADGTQPSLPGLPTPNVQVSATLRSGDSISLGDEGYDAGPILFQGATDPVTLVGTTVQGEGVDQVTAEQVGDEVLYTFQAPLQRMGENFSKALGFTLRIDVLIDTPGCDPDASLMTNSLAPYADAGHWSHIVLTHGKPLQVNGAGVTQSNASLEFGWSVTSAWGNYDVDVANATLEVLGPVAVVPVRGQTIQRFNQHFHLNSPVQQHWSLDPSTMPDGTYTARFEVPNLQHTATAQATVTFAIQDGRLVDAIQATPAAPVGLVLLGLAALALQRR